MSFFTDTAATAFKFFRLGNSLSEPHIYEYHSLDPSNPYDQVNSRKVHKKELSSLDYEGKLRICVVSDTHDRHYLLESMPQCDILIHAGDIFMTNRMTSTEGSIYELRKFNEWLGKLDAKYKLVIGGNHDLVLETLGKERSQELLSNALYLCNSGVELLGLNIFGTPLSRGHSANRAFQSTEFLQDAVMNISKYKDSGKPIDIFVSHGPNSWLGQEIQPTVMHIYGHVHTSHGVRSRKCKNENSSKIWYEVGAPIMDSCYNPSQVPLVVDIPRSNCVSMSDNTDPCNGEGAIDI